MDKKVDVTAANDKGTTGENKVDITVANDNDNGTTAPTYIIIIIKFL